MIKVSINNICAKLTECEPLVAGMIGKTLDVELSTEWGTYTKTAVFSNGDTTRDVIESRWTGNTIPIPDEVLAIPNRTVVMGMYGFGVENGTVHALPTIYAKIGIPMVGADPTSDPTTDPSLPVYAQLQWQIDHFEISPEQIAQQIQEYLDEHPIEIQPATASVLGGVKVGEGLSVTADGTLSTEVTADDLDDLADIVDGKQDEITDLDEIRAGAALGETALQSVPSTYRTAAAQDIIDNSKVDKVAGKGLSTNDYTNADKAKVDSALTDDDTEEAEVIELADVATSGDYNDLINKPTLFSGSYNDLTNKPTIPEVPTNVSAFTNDSGYLTLATLPKYDGSVR